MLIGDLTGIAFIFASISAVLSMVSCDSFSMRLDASRERTHMKTWALILSSFLRYTGLISMTDLIVRKDLSDPPLILVGLHNLLDRKTGVCYYQESSCNGTQYLDALLVQDCTILREPHE